MLPTQSAILLLMALLVLACGEDRSRSVTGPEAGGEPFLFAANGSEPENAFYQNAVVFETPFMHLPYEQKHALNDAELAEYAGFSWFASIRAHQPEMRIILRYTATREGRVPADFDRYLADEMATLERYLQAVKDRGWSFDLYEFGDEFNLAGMLHLNFTAANVLEYYDQGLRTIARIMPKARICADVIPVYAYNDSVYSPGGGRTLLQMGEAVEDVALLSALKARGAPFTVVGTEIQPGAHTYHDPIYIERYLESLFALGLEVYIWEFWILSRPLAHPNEMERGIFGRNAPPGGYTERWQAETLHRLLEFFAASGRVIGFNYMNMHDGTMTMNTSEPYPSGLIREDGTPKEAYEVFMAWREKWQRQ